MHCTYLVLELLRAILSERRETCCKDRERKEDSADDPHVDCGGSQSRACGQRCRCRRVFMPETRGCCFQNEKGLTWTLARPYTRRQSRASSRDHAVHHIPGRFHLKPGALLPATAAQSHLCLRGYHPRRPFVPVVISRDRPSEKRPFAVRLFTPPKPINPRMFYIGDTLVQASPASQTPKLSLVSVADLIRYARCISHSSPREFSAF